MTGVAAAVGGYRREALRIAGVALVVDQGPGAVERGRAQIVGVPAHRVAGRIADAAIDALDAGIRRAAGGAVGRDRLDRLVARLRGREHALRLLPLLEE